MLHLRTAVMLVLPAFTAALPAQTPTPAQIAAPPPSTAVSRYVKVPAAARGIYLQHVRIIGFLLPSAFGEGHGLPCADGVRGHDGTPD